MATAPRFDTLLAEHGGFNLHASVAIAGDDDVGRERLMRYGARPPFALERVRRLPGGRIAYRIKKVRGGRSKLRVMTPLELLARLAAIVPPPRYPLVRYHGVLGPRSAWRRDIVPRAPTPDTPCVAGEARDQPERKAPSARASDDVRGSTGRPSDGPDTRTRTPAHPAEVPSAPPQGTDGATVELTPNVLAVKHWDRLLGGLLYAATPRVDWATLLRRSFDVDVLRCAACSGRMRVLGEVTRADVIVLVLESLGLPTHAPRAARARDPTELLGEQDVE